MVLGAFESAEYEERTVTAAGGDRVLLFTDGMVDPADFDDQEFGDERLVQLVVRRRDQPAPVIADAALDEVTDFSDGRLEDDATVVVVAIVPR
jgi:sigma-B regulation protein RsbU (phosphoserine phosphatase)